MRTLLVAVLVGTVGFASHASADAWRAKAALIPSSPKVCGQADVSTVVLNFRQEGDRLIVETPNKEVYYAPITPDGSVRGPITVPVGDRRFPADLVGQMASREMTVTDRKFSCRFQLVPVP